MTPPVGPVRSIQPRGGGPISPRRSPGGGGNFYRSPRGCFSIVALKISANHGVFADFHRKVSPVENQFHASATQLSDTLGHHHIPPWLPLSALNDRRCLPKIGAPTQHPTLPRNGVRNSTDRATRLDSCGFRQEREMRYATADQQRIRPGWLVAPGRLGRIVEIENARLPGLSFPGSGRSRLRRPTDTPMGARAELVFHRPPGKGSFTIHFRVFSPRILCAEVLYEPARTAGKLRISSSPMEAGRREG